MQESVAKLEARVISMRGKIAKMSGQIRSIRPSSPQQCAHSHGHFPLAQAHEGRVETLTSAHASNGNGCSVHARSERARDLVEILQEVPETGSGVLREDETHKPVVAQSVTPAPGMCNWFFSRIARGEASCQNIVTTVDFVGAPFQLKARLCAHAHACQTFVITNAVVYAPGDASTLPQQDRARSIDRSGNILSPSTGLLPVEACEAQTPESLLEGTPMKHCSAKHKEMEYSVSSPIDVLDIRGVGSDVWCRVVDLIELCLVVELIELYLVWRECMLISCNLSGVPPVSSAQCTGGRNADEACLHHSASQGCQVICFLPFT